MQFKIEKAIEILNRTPDTLINLLYGLSDDWIKKIEGKNTWSPIDIVGHLIHGEETDWIVRADIILSKADKKFKPFDRFAQQEKFKGKSMQDLLEMFKKLRKRNLMLLNKMDITDQKLKLWGIHPEFGKITLKQLIAAWVVHDLSHISQIVRVLSKHYTNEVGPFIKYLKILHQ